MVPYLGCEHAREMLQAFVDGELPVGEQVAVESHLRWCTTCAAHVDDLRLIGESLRFGAVSGHSVDEAREIATLHDGVLARIRAEHDQSFAVQVRGLFDDLHLLWAGLGAVTAVLVCLFGTMSVLHAASDERPDSLAGIIQSLANPGSERNPVRIGNGLVLGPRAADEAPPALQMPEDEAVFALAAVVTREGRVANYEVLLSELGGARRRETSVRDVSALLDVVARSRFNPAQRVGGAPVAVNMVWLLARTTVKGTPRALDFESPDATAATVPAPVVPAVKPAPEGPMEEASLPEDAPISRRARYQGRSRTV
jgi:hypothetical protein